MSVPFRLRVEGGPNAGQSFTLTDAGATLGRQDGNTIVLDDGRLSRQHARIDLGPGGLTLTDLGSANGTRVNGQRVSGTQSLHPGDQLQLGETTIVVEGGSTPAEGGATVLVSSAAAATTPLPPRDAGAARLVLQGSGRVFPLDQPALVIGRQPGNAIQIEDSQASRQHARIEVRGDQLTVTDLGSANGTRVNGSAIGAPTPLHEGDIVQVGTSQFRVEGWGAAPPPAGIADATVIGGPPFAAAPSGFGSAGPSGTAPLPPLGGPPPPQFSPAGQPRGVPVPPPPQFGVPPPQFGQVGVPPPTSPRRRSGLPLILGGLAALALLLCVGGGVAGALFLRDRATETPVAPTVAASGTSVVGAANTPLPTRSVAAFPGGGGSSAAPFPGGGSGNPTLPPPSAAPAPTVVPLPTATVAPTVMVAPTATTAATATPAPTRLPFTPTPPRPTATVAPRPTQPAPPAGGGGLTITVASVGLSFSLPAGWTQERDEAERATFLSPDRRAQIVVRWSTQVPTGLTAQRLVQEELQRTATEDPTFVPTSARVGSVEFGGQPGYGSDPYSYALQDGTRLTEADRAVVLAGRAQYFFGFTALEPEFSRYAAPFDGIIGTVVITGP